MVTVMPHLPTVIPLRELFTAYKINRSWISWELIPGM